MIVIGNELREKFFPLVDPIGKTIKIAGFPMFIVGVEEKRERSPHIRQMTRAGDGGSMGIGAKWA